MVVGSPGGDDGGAGHPGMMVVPGRLRPLDLEFMQRLSKIVNVVPVIAKADTLTLEERAEFKQRVRARAQGAPRVPCVPPKPQLKPRIPQIQEDLKTHAISVYPQEDFDQDPDDRLLNDRIRVSVGMPGLGMLAPGDHSGGEAAPGGARQHPG